jgi:hypothetical protein
MAKVYKFELVAGLHSVSEGQYLHAAKPGEPPVVVISGDRLDEIFGESKFKYVGDVEVPAEPEVPADDKKGKK